MPVGIDSYTKLLLHMDGNSGAQVFIDSSLFNQTIAVSGSVYTNVSQKKFGPTSGYFNGSLDALRMADSEDLNYGSGDWTIETWVRFTSVTGYQVFYDHGYQTVTTRCIVIYWGANSLNIAQSTDGSANQDIGRAWTPSINTWYHLAAVRTGAVVKLFIDGTQLGADITAQNVFNTSRELLIGNEAGANYFLGYLDEYRISKGIARWTTTFTPPTDAYHRGQNLQMIL